MTVGFDQRPRPLHNLYYTRTDTFFRWGMTVTYSRYKFVWLGWAYLTKTVRKPQHGGVNFDPPMIFCACSMQNIPAASEIPQDDFRTK